ncbi:type I polyketide synthase [Actinospica robiniae]|uniref:type I polyketide synthase n=1 Tax=Actinospica robiniae TaxID=304901 RepID=UPI000685FF9B|nr:type I polyketide synthase [Actinospica robiniae]
MSPTEAGGPLSVAVVGVASLLPGSSDVRGFWRDVVAGRDLLSEVPPSHWLISDYHDPDPSAPDRTYARRGAFLSPVRYDPIRYGTSPAVLSATDTAQLLALPVAESALRDATGGDLGRVDGERAGVVVGTGALELLLQMACRMQRPVWLNALRECGVPEPEAQRICARIAEHYVPWQEATFPGLLANVIAGRIANRLDLHGANFAVDAACASSLAALSCAVNELELGRADLMLAGGVDTFNDITMFTCFSKTPALSPTGDCRPFSDHADGTMLGEGLVFFALKRLADAERDGDRVYAVLRGLGASSDGSGNAVYAPAPAGQARALRRAYAQADYAPRTVELVEGHGTGTPAGDAAEVAALAEVFGPAERPWCALGSAKSQFGHTKSAAGAVGLLKAVLALHHRVLPPTIKVDRPSAALTASSSPLYINTKARPWVRGTDHPRRAAVSSFGFGGSNFHVTLEEYLPGTNGRHHPRLKTDATESTLTAVDDGRGAPGKVAFLFCGQGAQYPDMGADLAMAFPAALSAWDELATDRYDGIALHEVVLPRPAFSDHERASQRELLTATEWAQPALAVTCAAQLRLVAQLGLRPDCVAGHSLGELVALAAAGCLDERSLVALARRRGELMRDAADQPGAMLAVFADAKEAAELAADRDDVWVANLNSPTQTVLSGTAAGIDEVERRAEAGGVAVHRLATATAFHSPLVSAASAPLREFLGAIDVSAPRLPVYGTSDASQYSNDPDAVRARVAEQVGEPVRFVDQIEAMYADGVRTFIEFGAGSALTGMVGQILDGRDHLAVALDQRGLPGVAAFQEALGRLAARGVPFDAGALTPAEEPAPPDERPSSGMTVELVGSNYARPYPPPGGETERAMPNNPPEQLPAPMTPVSTVVAAPVPVPAPAPAAGSDSWIGALQEIQRQTSEAHAAYQHALADGHAAYLRTSEATLSGMIAALDGAVRVPVSSRPLLPTLAPPSAPSLPAARVLPRQPSPPAPAPQPIAPPPPRPAPAPAPSPAPVIPAAPSGPDLEGVVISIIADLTGYPADILQPDMELGHDLGIDSIKRVQILARMRERVPDLPNIDPAQLAGIATIGETITFLRRHGSDREPSQSADAEGEPNQ